MINDKHVDNRQSSIINLKLMALLLAFISLGAAYSIVNPLHEATDELRHYRFVRHIVQQQSLPVQGEVGCSAQGHHPPLFYTLGAALTFWVETGRDVCYEPPTNPFWNYRYWEVGVDNKNQYLPPPDASFPWRGEALAAHLVRFLNVLIGATAVFLTYRIGRTIWPKRPYLALGGAAFIAFNPMFLYMAGAINNDVIAALSGAAVTLACVMLLYDEEGLRLRWGLILGGLLGIALLSKFNLIAIALTVETAVSWVAFRKRQWRAWWRVNWTIFGVTVLVAGWWFVRNQLLYGEPTGVQRLTELWGVRDPRESFWLAIFELSYAWTSLWGRFGYGQIPLPEPIYTALRWLIGVGWLGLLLPFLRRDWQTIRDKGPALFLLLLNCLLFFGVLFNYLLVSPAGPMGRFFFPALPSLALLTFLGWSEWVRLPSAIIRKPYSDSNTDNGLWITDYKIPALAANLFMVTLSLIALFGYLAPAYAQPEETGVNGQTAVNAQFDFFVRLNSYTIHQPTVQPGDYIDIDLHWEVLAQPPGNYLMFVHLIDETGIMVAQRDTHPGLGNFPSSQWQPGQQFADRVRLHLPQTAYAPSNATLSVGLYATDGYRLGITDAGGAGLGDALPLATIPITQPPNPQFPNPQADNFENGIRFLGYEYSQRQPAAGDFLDVTLYWEAITAVSQDYRVRVRLLTQNGDFVTAASHPPPTPTSSWAAGHISTDPHRLELPPDLPSGNYIIHVALIDAQTKDQQNIIGEDGRLIDSYITLAGVHVQNNTSTAP